MHIYIFLNIFHRSPVIVLKDIKISQLEALLAYMYIGEVDVEQSELDDLVKAAESLQIKGLTVPEEDPIVNKTAENQISVPNSSINGVPKRAGVSLTSSPTPKKKQRKNSENKTNSVSNDNPKYSSSTGKGGSVSAIAHSQQQLSSVKKVTPGLNNELEILPIQEIKIEEESYYEDPLKIVDLSSNDALQGSSTSLAVKMVNLSSNDALQGSNTSLAVKIVDLSSNDALQGSSTSPAVEIVDLPIHDVSQEMEQATSSDDNNCKYCLYIEKLMIR